MIQVFEARHLAEAHFVGGLLQAEGIPVEIRGDSLFSILGTGTSVPGVLPTVWIQDPADTDKAAAIVARFAEVDPDAQAGDQPWSCPKCQEVHELQFSACWKCGTQRPAGTTI